MSDDKVHDLLVGVAEMLDGFAIGEWSPTAAPVAGSQTPLIVLRAFPPQPERIISITDYGNVADARTTEFETLINIRIRGDRASATASGISARIFEALHALGRYTLGTAPNQVKITDIQWRSETSLGPDSIGRTERSLNYAVLWNRAHARLT